MVMEGLNLYCPKLLTDEQKNITATVLTNFAGNGDATIQLDLSALPYADSAEVESVVKGRRHGQALDATTYNYDSKTKILTIGNNDAETYVITVGDSDKEAGYASDFCQCGADI